MEIRQSFQVAASPDTVWAFMLNPENVVACMPGATLTEVVDATRFRGTVKVRVGAVTAQYQGTITYLESNRNTGTVRMLAEGNERGGGTVRGTIVTTLVPTAGGAATDVECQANVDLTGRIVQVGRGMIEGVSAQIIRMYVDNVRGLLERPVATAAGTAAPEAAQPPVRQESINMLAVILRALGAWLRRLFRRGGSA